MKHLNLRKTVLAMMASLFISSSAFADDGIKIRVVKVDGMAPVEYAINDIRKITFQEYGFTIMLHDGTSDSSMEYSDVQKMVFDNVNTGIDNVKSEKVDDIAITYNGSVIKVSGCEKAAQLRLFDIAGRPVISQNIVGEAEISTENLASGVYILRVNNKTFKFNKF